MERYFLAGALLLVAGCVHQPPAACVGRILPVPQGLVPVQAAPPAQAMGAVDAGGLCQAQVYTVAQPVKVYRVWDAAKPYTQWGRWWSFAPPRGSKVDYRRDNAICTDWSPLTAVSECQLKVGSEVTVGTGQSVRCPDHSQLPQSAVNQVYVPNDASQQDLKVDACGPVQPWLP